MATGMHVGVPLPRFRLGACTPPPILSGGVSSISYRWRSADCAASIEHQTLTRTPFCKNIQRQPFDGNWKNQTDNDNGRYRQNATTTRVAKSATTLSQPQQGGTHENQWFNSDNEKSSVGITWSGSQASSDCTNLVGKYTNMESFKANKERSFEISNSKLVLKSNKTVSRVEEECHAIENIGNSVNGKVLVGQSVDQTDAALITRCQSTEHSKTNHKLATKSFRATRHDEADNCRSLKTKSQERSNNKTGDTKTLKTKSQEKPDNITNDSRSLKTKETHDGGISESTFLNLELGIRNVNGSTVSKVQKKTSTSSVTELACAIDDILVVDDLETAQAVVSKLRGEYKDFVHACDTEVSEIEVKKESPVGHGKVICFSIYCGPDADFGNGKNCVWVDVLDTSKEVMAIFKEYFEDSSIKKVWHNFSFDRHVLANHGIIAGGFYADTMHLARLWNSGRKGAEGGYSLESLTSDINVMNGVHSWDGETLTKKTSMKDLFGTAKIKKDGTEGSIKVIPPVDDIQRSKDLREKWICYSSGDALCTWRLWESLHAKLRERRWFIEKEERGTMYDFYNKFWRPFGEILVQMEAAGMLVDRDYLAEIEKVACKERATSISRFRKWAAKYNSNAQYINVTSDAQIRQLLFGGFNKVSKSRTFKIPNVDGYIEEGKKVPKKFRDIEISGIGVEFPVEILTSSGLPAVSIQALKNLAGKVSIDYSETEEADEFIPQDADVVLTSAGIESSNDTEEDLSVYGKAYNAFNGGQEGKEACKAIAALCEVSAIDTLISSFIQPLQGGDILGPDGRVHCSLNINTETGRLSARRPNLQNQPALEKDRYKIRQAFIARPGNSLIVADYGQLELRLLAHLAKCQSMLEAFKIGGDFHSRTAMNMYDHVKKAVDMGDVILEWEPKPGESRPPAPLLKDVYGSERRKAKMLNFSIAYGKTAKGLSKDWKVSLDEAKKTVNLWYRDRHEVRAWQEQQKKDACERQCVHTLLGRARHFPAVKSGNEFARGRIERAAINTPVQGSAADVAMLAMLEISRCPELKELGWKLLLQVHDEMILEGPAETAARAKDLVVKAMAYPFQGKNILKVDLVVDAKYANSWYAAK